MPFIAFLGCDGSGKSTVIDKITEQYSAERVTVELGHWRPSALGSDDGSGSAAEDPHGRKPRSVVGSVVKLGWIWLNWWIGWLGGLRKTARAGVLIFDRYHGDLLVDPGRYRYGGPVWLAEWWSRLLPQPDRVLFLDADEEILLARKREVPREALTQARSRYLALMERLPAGRVVDASGSLEQVVAQVRTLIDECNAGHG